MLSIGQLILAGLLKFVWIIFIEGPLTIVSYVADAIKYLTQGILWNVFFDTNGTYKNGVITPPNINDVKIPWIFIGFVIVAVFIGFLVFIWQIIKVIITKTKDTKEQKQGIIHAFKFFILGFLVCFSIPAFFFCIVAIMGFLSEAINLAFTGSTDQGGISDFLYLLGAPEGFTGPVPNSFAPPDDWVILKYNFFVQVLGTWFALFALLIVSWVIMLKMAELFFLMLISPFLAFSMPLDDGKRMVLYKNMVISKALVILGNLVMYYVYIILISLIHSTIDNSTWFNANGGSIAKGIVELAFIAGSSMAVFSASSIIASFVGESFGMREGMDTFRGFMGLAGMGGAMGLVAKGFSSPFRNASRLTKLGKQGVKKKHDLAHNKIDRQMSEGTMTKEQGILAHEKVGKHFWRKKMLNSIKATPEGLAKSNYFNSKSSVFGAYRKPEAQKEEDKKKHDDNSSTNKEGEKS